MPKKQAWAAAVVGEWRSISPGEFEDSDDDVREGDHVVGVLGHELRQMWTLHRRRLFATNTMQHTGTSLESMSAEIISATLYHMLLTSMREEFFELWDKHSIGVRKGFKAVWNENPAEGFPEDFAHALEEAIFRRR